MPFDARAFFGIVAQQARPCRGVSYRVSTSVPDTRHKIPLRPALFLYFANSSRLLPACFQPPIAETQTSLTITDCDVMTTWIMPSRQKKLKTVDNAL